MSCSRFPLITLTVVLLFRVATPHAQAVGQRSSGGGVFRSSETFGLSNGRLWVTLSSTERIALVRGVIDGWALRENADNNVSSGVPSLMNGVSPKRSAELSRMLDVAYANEENLNLPIGWVLMGSLAVERGATTTDVVMQPLRRHVADVAFRGLPIDGAALNPLDAILSASTKTP